MVFVFNNILYSDTMCIMLGEKSFIPKQEKPSVLYHASRNGIGIFEPRTDTARDENEGPKVFATPSRAMTSIFLVDCDDSWVSSGAMNDVPYIIISDEERYKSLDKGGTVYSLP